MAAFTRERIRLETRPKKPPMNSRASSVLERRSAARYLISKSVPCMQCKSAALMCHWAGGAITAP